MDINIYVNQKKINPLCQRSIAEYIKRLSPYCHLKVVCVPNKIKFTSGKNCINYALCNDNTISSEAYASSINTLTTGGLSRINYYIGYDESLYNNMSRFAVCTISPSNDMSAALLSEQIYRAYTILNNITYHK